MSRLTARTENGNAYLVNVKPDEQEVDSLRKNTLQCILDCFERLAQYEDAEEQGLLVVLPCKVGDTVFTIELDCKDNPDHSQMCFCWDKSCKECDKSYLRVWENRNKTADIRSIVAEMGLCGESGGFGKTVFLTRAEAEALCKEYGRNYYIKDSLRREMEKQ